MSIGYIVSNSLPFISTPFDNTLGGFGELLVLPAWLWVIPIQLSLQSWIAPFGVISTLFAFILGFGFVVFVGFYLQKIFRIPMNRKWYFYAWAFFLWPVLLIPLESIIALFVWKVLNLPVGV